MAAPDTLRCALRWADPLGVGADKQQPGRAGRCRSRRAQKPTSEANASDEAPGSMSRNSQIK
jgi:hypothetical protein